MSIKKKKFNTENAYRLKKIEDHLISHGYICATQTEGSGLAQRWIDCVEDGYDITFDPSNDVPDQHYAKEPRIWRDPTFRPLDSQYFLIHMEHGASGSADDIEAAIRKSRQNKIYKRSQSQWISNDC